MSTRNELLQMDLQPSHLLLGSLLTVHLLAIFAAVLADIPMPLSLGIIALLLPGCYRSCRKQYDVSYLQMGPGEVVLRYKGRLVAMTLEDNPWCNEWLQVLRFRPLQDAYSMTGTPGAMLARQPVLTRAIDRLRKRRLTVIILPDSASAQSRRRLRVLLRWHSFAGGVPV